MKIYITTCDQRIDQTIEMYEYCIQKYWPQADVYVLGYKQPVYKSDTIKFISLGEDKGPNHLNKQLYEYFSSVEDKNFIFNVDDMPIIRPVDNELITYTKELLESNKEIGRIGLSADNSNRPYIKISDIDNSNYSLFENTNTVGETYKLSAVWSAWNREYFLLYLNQYDNLWQWEVKGSSKSNSDNFKILGFIPAPIWFAHLIKQGTFKSTWNLEGVGHKFAADQVDQNKIKSIYDIK